MTQDKTHSNSAKNPMTYKEFLSTLQEGTLYDTNDYYHLILSYAPDILMDSKIRSQGLVAKDLGMTPVKFSHISNILKTIVTKNIPIPGLESIENIENTSN